MTPVWKALLKVKEVYMAGRKVNVKNGKFVRVWHDPIGTHPPLCEVYPDLFSIANYQDDTIAQFKSRDSGEIFRRRLNTDFNRHYEGGNDLVDSLEPVAGQDEIVWALDSKGKYTTKYVFGRLNCLSKYRSFFYQKTHI